MKIDAPTADDIREVALNMRERDFAEFSAVSPNDTRAQLAEFLAARFYGQPHTLCARTAAGPIAVGAAVETRLNVLSLLFFATDEFPTIAMPVTRFITQRLFPPLIAAGVHRIEAVALHGYAETERWLGVLGLSAETPPLRNYGKNGEAFRLFAWVKDARSPSD